MYCSKCGSIVDPDGIFCTNCGVRYFKATAPRPTRLPDPELPSAPEQLPPPERPWPFEQPERPAAEAPERPWPFEQPERPAVAEAPEQSWPFERPSPPERPPLPEQPSTFGQPEPPAAPEPPEQPYAPFAPTAPDRAPIKLPAVQDDPCVVTSSLPDEPMDTGAPAPRSLPSLDIDDLEPVDNEQDAAGSLATGALPADGAEPAGEDGPVIQPIEIKKRRSKLPVLIVIVLLLAAAIAALQFFILPNMQRAQAYRQALEQMEAQDYSSAMQSFDELDGYNDSRYYIAQCQLYIAYHDAMDMFEQGRFSEAFDAFNLLSMQSFLDSAAMTKKSLYNIADAQLKKGAREEAFLSFSALGDFEDAAARATSCLVAQPLTGPVQKAAAGDGATALIKVQIDGAKMDQPSFMKLYGKDGALVTSVFLRAKDSLTVELPAGTYRLNQATGANWFGTEIMFGTRGVYTTLHFNESDELVLESLHEYKITLGDSSRGNVNSQAIDAGAF